MICMSSSPFDSDSILGMITQEQFENVFSATLSPGNSEDLYPPAHKDTAPSHLIACLTPPEDSGNSSSTVAVQVGSEVVQLSVPIDLVCALMLTRSSTSGGSIQSPNYTLSEVLAASENLKRFRDIASGDHSLPSTIAPSSSSTSILPTPPPVISPSLHTSGPVDLIAMSLDVNGSIVVQEMIAKADDFERCMIFDQLVSSSVVVSTNTHGCRVVQRLLELGTPEQNYGLFRSIPRYKIVDLSMDVNGNHVMQKFVDCLPQFALHEIVGAIMDGGSAIARLSLHSYGCRVIQRLLVKCSEEDRSTILSFVISCYADLVCDQFGNYVAQHSLEYSNEAEKRSIISVLTVMDVSGLCCNKFASNVIEKAVRVKFTDKTTVLHRLIATIIQDEETLLSLMKDKYGNYVVKAICDLNTHEFPQVTYVKNVLIQNAAILKKYTYGFHLVERLDKGNIYRRDRIGSSMSDGTGSSADRRSRGGSH